MPASFLGHHELQESKTLVCSLSLALIMAVGLAHGSLYWLQMNSYLRQSGFASGLKSFCLWAVVFMSVLALYDSMALINSSSFVLGLPWAGKCFLVWKKRDSKDQILT